MEAWNLKMKPWMVWGRPIVADWHHFDETPDADPHSSEKSGRISRNVKRGIRILIKEMRTRNIANESGTRFESLKVS
jgi:hypothetical protein